MKLADQPFRLLAVLLERPGEVITRQELQERLWADSSFGDFNDGLNTAINKVRAALDDDADNPRFVETVPRRGYRFIARVDREKGLAGSPGVISNQTISPESVVPQKAVSAPLDRPPTAIRVERGFRGWKLAVIAVPAVAAGVFALWWFTPLAAPQVTRTDQITYSARIDTPVKPASDGEHVYYLQRAGDHWDLMQTSLGGGDGHIMQAPGKSAVVLDVSRDRSRILLSTFEKRDGDHELWSAPSQGGAAVRLGVIASDGVFSPDGTQIAYLRDSSLLVMNASGLNERKLSELPGPPSWLAWSPGGKRLRFTISLPNDGGESLWEVSAEGKNLRRLRLKPSDASSVCCGAWTPDGRYYVFTAFQNGQANVWAARDDRSWRRNAHRAYQLTFGPNSAFSGKAGGDGKHIFFYSGVWRQQLERLDLRTRQFVPLPIAANAVHVAYSKDGKWIAYVDGQGRGLLRRRVDGGEELQLAPADLSPTFPRWSPDGKWIIFMTANSTVIVPSAGGHPEALLPAETEINDPDWSSDGTRVVFSGQGGGKGSDGRELLILDVATKRTEEIPGSDHMAMSRWSPDGRYISATDDQQNQLKLWDTSKKEWHLIARGSALGISVWSPDARYLYFQDLLGDGEQIYRYDVSTRSAETVFDFSAFLKSGISRCALFGMAPDGSPIIGFTRSNYDLFAAEVVFP